MTSSIGGLATLCSTLTTQRVSGVQIEKGGPSSRDLPFCETFTNAYTAIFSERDVREPGTSNGITRP